MQKTTFGKTNLTVSRTGMGCIPIQRISYEASTALLQRAYEAGITLYDTANGYTTSEDRIGTALHHVRQNIVLCTKSSAKTPETLMAHIENSLEKMRTGYIDVFQFHNPNFVPRPGDETGLYETALKAKEQGKIRHIGITAHKKNLALEAVESDLYETLQYPFSYLSSADEVALVELCNAKNMGVLSMKALCGGLLTNAKAAFAFQRQYDVVPIWGIEKMHQLEEFIAYEANPPAMDEEMLATIEADKKSLAGSFCRSCGYCLPCPVNIPIPQAARLSFLMGRTVREKFETPEWEENMRGIDNCLNCGHCTANCPYELDVPTLLRSQQKTYFEAMQALKS